MCNYTATSAKGAGGAGENNSTPPKKGPRRNPLLQHRMYCITGTRIIYMSGAAEVQGDYPPFLAFLSNCASFSSTAIMLPLTSQGQIQGVRTPPPLFSIRRFCLFEIKLLPSKWLPPPPPFEENSAAPPPLFF